MLFILLCARITTRNAPGFAPVHDACGVHGGFDWPEREMYACGFKEPGSLEPADCMKSGPINGYTIDTRSAIFGDDPRRRMQYPPGTSGTKVVRDFLAAEAAGRRPEGTQAATRWVAGGSAEVSQGYWESNHGGGYQYRLCAVSKFGDDALKNEECFQVRTINHF
jgi:hypothetical protein